MKCEDIKKLIESNLKNTTAIVKSHDNVHFEAEVICPDFEGKSRIQQHQMINQILNDSIKSGEIHALSLKTRAA